MSYVTKLEFTEATKKAVLSSTITPVPAPKVVYYNTIQPGDIGVIQDGPYKGSTVLGLPHNCMVGLNDPASLYWSGLGETKGNMIYLLPSKTQIVMTVKS